MPGAQRQWYKSLMSIGEDNLHFYPNFALFSTLREMSLDQDFFQMSKLSEDQKKNKTKKRSSIDMEHFFSPNSGEDQKTKKEGLHQKWNTFFPRIQVQTCAQMHTRVKLLEGMQMTTILKLLGGYSQIIGGDISPSSPPDFGTTAQRDVNLAPQ